VEVPLEIRSLKPPSYLSSIAWLLVHLNIKIVTPIHVVRGFLLFSHVDAEDP